MHHSSNFQRHFQHLIELVIFIINTYLPHVKLITFFGNIDYN